MWSTSAGRGDSSCTHTRREESQNTVATSVDAPPGGATGLKRQVGLIGLLWASEGSIIGSGWLFGAQGALQYAGPAAIISWGIGAVAIIILALVHAELGGMFPHSGGTARYPHYAFGGAAGASFGWFAWLQAASVAPIEVMAVIKYGQHYSFTNGWQKANGTLSGSGIVVAIVLMAILTAINFLSVRMLANTNSAATSWKVGVPLLTIFVLGVANFHGGNFTAGGGFAPMGMKGILQAVSVSGIIFALLGFEQAIQIAGESSNPKRDIPLATVLSILIGAVIYIGLQITFLGALTPDLLKGGWATGAYSTLTGPFAQVATAVSVGWLATVLYIDAVISPAGTGLIYTTATARLSYGLSRNGYVPKAFEKIDKRGVPWTGLIATFILGCIAFLPFPSWKALVGLVTNASVLMYAGAPLAFGVFRQKLANVERPYRLPGGVVIGPIAFIIANYLILWNGWTTAWKLGVAILLGYVILVINRVFKLNPTTPALDFRAAQWLPVYLVGTGLIIYFSDFGPRSNPPFGLGWDMLVLGVFSLGIYFWALAVALPAERIEQLIDQVEVVEAPAH
jgi:amino acid transporter